AYQSVLLYTHTWYAESVTLLGLAGGALALSPAQLPDLIRRVMAALPQLRRAQEAASPDAKPGHTSKTSTSVDEENDAESQDDANSTDKEQEESSEQTGAAAEDVPPEDGPGDGDDQPAAGAEDTDELPEPSDDDGETVPPNADGAQASPTDEGNPCDDPRDEADDPAEPETAAAGELEAGPGLGDEDQGAPTEEHEQDPALGEVPSFAPTGDSGGIEEGTLTPGSVGDAPAEDPDEPFDNPLGDTLSDPRITADGWAQALQDEAQAALRDAVPAEPQFLQEQAFKAGVPEPQAARIAPLIQTRFDMPRGAIEIVAPGRFDRLEAARGNLPYRMSVVTPGGDVPAPNVVIAVDVSSSMYWTKGKIQSARTAAQAVALAVTRAGGKVLGLLFDDGAYVSPARDGASLFAPLATWPTSGGTSFAFLSQVWREYPDYRVIVVTDGDGCTPPATGPDRERTVGVVIPGNDKPEVIAQVCSRVVKLEQLQKLPQVLAALMPRSATR
ncbi:MAG TPA: hypothetical protein VGA61_00060, partial [Anaerolineae bacterium]